jgi:hypothetical protein
MTSVVISQPMLFPWPGFFEQMMLADVYIYLDDTQFSKGSFVNRIQVALGEQIKWMTIPLAGKGSFQEIKALVASSPDWQSSNLSLLMQSFRKAPFRNDALQLAEAAFSHKDVCSVLIASIEVCADYLGIKPRFRELSSNTNVPGRSWNRVLELVRAYEGTRYLTGHGAANYLNHEAFENEGVAVEYMCYSRTRWPQNRAMFTPYVSVLDLIAHAGPDAASYLHPASRNWRDFLAARG